MFLHTPGSDDALQLDYRLGAKNVQLINIGIHSSVPQRLIGASILLRLIQSHLTDLDCILLRGPSPLLLPLLAKICRNVPKALLLVGNQLDGVDDLPQPRWRKEMIRLFWKWNICSQKKISRDALTFINSKRLFNEYKEIAPELFENPHYDISEEDIYVREDTCNNIPINVVYAGRIDVSKGLMEIAQAVIELNNSGLPVI